MNLNKKQKPEALKHLLRRYLPLPDSKMLKEQRYLKPFNHLLGHPNLWHLTRTSVCRAFALGLFIAFLPIPFQMIVAALFAIPLRANIPLSVCLVWISNPFTITLIVYSAYLLGSSLLGVDMQNIHITVDLQGFLNFLTVWKPILLGCLIFSTVSAIIGYYGMAFLWRWHALQRIKKRLHLRKVKQLQQHKINNH